MHYIFENKDVFVAKLKRKFITAVICDAIWFFTAIGVLLLILPRCNIVPILCLTVCALIFVTLILHERVLSSHAVYLAFRGTPSAVNMDGVIYVISRGIRLPVTPAHRNMTGVFCHIDLSNLVYRLGDN